MKRTILILLTLVVAAVVNAQRPPAPAYPVFLLTTYPSVRKDMGVSPAVSKKIDKLQAAWDKKHMAMISPIPSKPGQINNVPMGEIVAEKAKADNAILALLTPQQKVRLKQIGYQYAGPFGIGEPEVAQALGITDDQKTKLMRAGRAAIKRYGDATKVGNPHVMPGKGSKPESTVQRFLKARLDMLKSLDVEVSKILTAKQRAQWKAMQGKPFPVATLYAPVMKR